AEVDAGLAEQRPEFAGRLHHPAGGEGAHRYVEAARNVPGPETLPRLRGFAAEALGGTGVDDHAVAGAGEVQDLEIVGDHFRLEMRVEDPGGAPHLAGFGGAPLEPPARGAAVEHPHV